MQIDDYTILVEITALQKGTITVLLDDFSTQTIANFANKDQIVFVGTKKDNAYKFMPEVKKILDEACSLGYSVHYLS